MSDLVPFTRIALPLPDPRIGKVRVSYALPDDRRLFVTTDRLSAFDRVIAGVPYKGQVLNQLAAFVAAGRPVLGICNGFQALVRSGLLPGAGRHAALGHNESGRFDCRWVRLAPRSERCIWTAALDDEIECPIAHGEGRFTCDDETLSALVDGDQIALTYAGVNPNGSRRDVAGICDPTGVVLGLMPHPENHVVARQHPRAARGTAAGLGLRLFEEGVRYAKEL